MIRFAIIGCGRIVEGGHLSGLRPLLGRDFEAVAVADPYEPRRELVGEALGLAPSSRYADYREVLARDDVELVDLALPHHLHEEVAVAAARAGKHILSEKPLAADAAGARRIARAVRESGVKFHIVHNVHFIEPHRTAAAAIAAGRIGKPFCFRQGGGGFGFFAGRSEDPAWRTKRALAGGGCVLDMCYHTIYMAEAFMQSPVVSASASLGTFVQTWDVEDTAAIVLNHASGGITQLFIAQGIKGRATGIEEIYGTEGQIRFERGENPLKIYENSVEEWKTLPLIEGPADFHGVFASALRAFQGEESPLFSLETALHTQTIVEAIYAAAREKRVAQVAEFES